MYLHTASVLYYFVLAALAVPTFAAPAPAAEVTTLGKRDISQALFDELVLYAKWSQTARPDSCPKPLGNTLIQQIDNRVTETQGIIARDDTRKEIIVSFRGTEHPIDFVVDAIFVRLPFLPLATPSSFVSRALRTSVHAGFLTSYNSVARTVVNSVRDQLNQHAGYKVVTVGHSLGGALASLAAVALKANFPDVPLRVYTYGQPRTGDRAYANLVESLVGAGNIFRSVHTTDIVAHIPPQELGYRHHGTEFWQFEDPASLATVKQCSGQEDATCSEGNPGSLDEGIDAHSTYYGITLGDNPDSLCQ